MNLRKGDTVQILSGKDRGKKGKILNVYSSDRRIVVDGINVKIKHRKPKKAGEKGSKIEIFGWIPESKAMIVCSKCGKPARIGKKVSGDKKVRICKKCGAEN